MTFVVLKCLVTSYHNRTSREELTSSEAMPCESEEDDGALWRETVKRDKSFGHALSVKKPLRLTRSEPRS